MADSENDRPMYLATDGIRVGVLPNGQIGMLVGKPHPSLGFAPDLVFSVGLSPLEALALADLLQRKAREAQGAPSPTQ